MKLTSLTSECSHPQLATIPVYIPNDIADRGGGGALPRSTTGSSRGSSRINSGSIGGSNSSCINISINAKSSGSSSSRIARGTTL